ncbi:uncharacterized protein C1orf159 homolog isoform X1 [Scleropages formosus]|uniref:uncharacterized protein C1orf159 homolog isoform X1 n=1 Tax=Scleropages formosus TaxID=113540 RepID=UPI0008784099|nr:uncharacterized protein C1orf159 homolog isoform X1 [Scleropages formosus]XP_018606761.1 uncharacterized protein C1orf159 homolog isoform X1 [Scleropages formosus]XP_018606762.1 uncharacterized protein C1orf159 homolog isoform X1 [Scleropages formosus]XP_018606763.1 uncharacterized protein C1orf159 homolog isoform X1 [Scleropages formosus]XP_018606764.1 uncharacterized protein C1orf159 homolog isoform X1 [Scleropages formosus]
MAWTYVTVFAGAALQVVCETSVTQVPLLSSGPCCGDSLLGNGTCRSSAHCGPGCYPRVSDNDTARCVPCDSELPGQDNVTSCNYTDAPGKENMTTLATAMPKIGGPGVAASLLLGTLLISLFLILSVASFFYLKRSNRLPALFYRRKNGRVALALNALRALCFRLAPFSVLKRALEDVAAVENFPERLKSNICKKCESCRLTCGYRRARDAFRERYRLLQGKKI